jgi:hypothetical protein
MASETERTRNHQQRTEDENRATVKAKRKQEEILTLVARRGTGFGSTISKQGEERRRELTEHNKKTRTRKVPDEASTNPNSLSSPRKSSSDTTTIKNTT